MTSSDSLVEKLRRSFAARDEQERADGSCPDPATLWDASHRRLDPDQFRNVLDHVICCPSCAADWRFAIEADQTAVAAAPRAEARRWFGDARFALATAAAVILALTTFAVSQFEFFRPAEPVYRATDIVIRSLVPEGESLAREQAILRWTPMGEGAVYSIVIGTIDLTPLATIQEVGESRLTIPPEALDRIEDGETIVWQIEAQLPDGRRIASEGFLNRIE
jgi:hypothetical protein